MSGSRPAELMFACRSGPSRLTRTGAQTRRDRGSEQSMRRRLTQLPVRDADEAIKLTVELPTISADIARHTPAQPPPSVTQAGAAMRRLEQPWRASRRQRKHGGAAQRTGMPATDARRECRQHSRPNWNPRGSQHRSFEMMKGRNLAGKVSFDAARTRCGRGRPRPGVASGRPVRGSGRGGRRARPGGRHCEQRLGKGPARPPGPAAPLNAHQTGIKRRGTCTGF
jgi:hypothetical protein